MLNFQEYLISKGAANADEVSKNKLWQEYRQEYVRQYNQKRKTHSKRVEILFPLSEYDALQTHAQSLGIKKSSEYIRKAIKATVSQVYITPSPEATQEATLALKRVGAHLNQIAYRVNDKMQTDNEDIAEAYKLLARIQENVFARLTPIHLEHFIAREQAKNSAFLEHLQRMIDDAKHLSNDHDNKDD